MDIRKIIKEEIDDFDWVNELKPSNTEKLIDLINKTLDRLPLLYTDRKDEFSYGWVKQVRSELIFINYGRANNGENYLKTMIGAVFLWKLIEIVNESLDIIKMTVTNLPKDTDEFLKYSNTYEKAREKIENVKDHLEMYLNTNSINL